jgi:hypothetical protein
MMVCATLPSLPTFRKIKIEKNKNIKQMALYLHAIL